jgi:plasmid stabilization system protein ParE
MKRLRVIIPPTVQDQITEQVLYIASDSIDNALAWEQNLRKAIEKIGETHGHAVDEAASNRLGFQVHKVVFDRTYLIHYCIDDVAHVVKIVNFRHGSRLPRRGEP